MIRTKQQTYRGQNQFDPAQVAADRAKYGPIRSRSSQEVLEQRPEALSSGFGRMRQIGTGSPYAVGQGNPLIEREDLER